ncbi:MAG: T9SS type A sorting domain-containing protein [Deferribacteres bacterium]|nr:T9SS type A sorting domain-containing protein [candidate division KSB1 bacterium]MCB9501447.1 T9SS type A sorting domain-containing protein [Deferribacteres bacterium]
MKKIKNKAHFFKFALLGVSLAANLTHSQTIIDAFEQWPDSSHYKITNGSEGNSLEIELITEDIKQGSGAFQATWRVQANSFAGIWTQLDVLHPDSAAVQDYSQFTELDLWFNNILPSSSPQKVSFQINLLDVSNAPANVTDALECEWWTASFQVLDADSSLGWQLLTVPLQQGDIGSRETIIWTQSSRGIQGNNELDLDKIRGIAIVFAGSASLLSGDKTANGVIALDYLSLRGEAQGDFAKAVEIVVLGSSTAEGTGPVDWNNAWVNLYRDALKTQNIYHQVHNLAKGGYTTYQLLPTGTAVPGGRPTPDTQRNITKALALSPDAIIINLPSNDAAYGYSLQEQLANYTKIVDQAQSAGVPLWITTTQPRNLDAAGRQALMDMRDSTFTRYGKYAVDFWTVLALPDGTIDPIFDSGDHIHLNDSAHKILFARVDAAHIPDSVSTNVSTPDVVPAKHALLQNYPNPFNNATMIVFELQKGQIVQLEVVNLLGQKVATLVNAYRNAGKHLIPWDAGALPSGVYWTRLVTQNAVLTNKMLYLR